MQELDFNIAVIGAGVIGLAVAEALSADTGQVLLLEKNERYGMETSSRNSEVIHAGLYYLGLPLETAFCTNFARTEKSLSKKPANSSSRRIRRKPRNSGR
jgi:L-2-hydroxyglutarate oxidase LhgO